MARHPNGIFVKSFAMEQELDARILQMMSKKAQRKQRKATQRTANSFFNRVARRMRVPLSENKHFQI